MGPRENGYLHPAYPETLLLAWAPVGTCHGMSLHIMTN